MAAGIFSRFFYWFNKQNAILIIFLLSLANFIGFTLLGGEEQYFAFAKQYMNPDWMPNSFILNHPAGGNLIFQFIFGYLLRYLSFEQLAFWGRLFNFLMYAIPLALIFKKFKLSNIAIIFLLQIAFFGNQSIWAEEWIFKNIEEKTIAYIFVFWSIYYLLNDKPVISSIFTALATYFHFLVGGWMFAFVLFYFSIYSKSFKTTVYIGLSYAIIVLPFAFYLAQIYFIDNPSIVNGVNTNAIYAFFRLKHHIGMFGDLSYFFSHHFIGVIITVVMFLICLLVYKKYNHPFVKQLNLLNIIIFSQQFIFIGIALLDKNGVFMKTYPFRTSSLSSLFFMFETAFIFNFYLNKKIYKYLITKFNTFRKIPYPKHKYVFKNGYNILLLAAFLPSFVLELNETVRTFNKIHDKVDTNMLNLISYVKEKTPKESVFLFVDGDEPLSFVRRAERERFVVEKFTPTKSKTIYEWHKRLLLKKKLRSNIKLIDSIKTDYRIDYLVSDSCYVYPSLVIERRFGKHNLYKIK